MILRSVLEEEVLIYLDDILLTYEIEKEHKEKIRKILELLTETDLKIKKLKCKYFKKRIKFLDFILKER